ncbi:MAG: hypothetical protein IAF94_25360, partial [Pirellulaceae bacterium]|nr:hypothetical protein [Pirellulaceae bacterium]
GRRHISDLIGFFAACFLTAGPWYVLCWTRNGQVFIDEFFWKHNLGRFVSADLQHEQPFWFYIPVLLGLLFPWITTPGLWWNRRGWRDPRYQLLALWLVWGFLFFSISTNKLPGYLLPLLPAAATLAGIRLADDSRARFHVTAAGAALAIVPLVAAVLPEALLRGVTAATFPAVPWVAMALSILLAVVLMLVERADRRGLALILAVIAVAVNVVFLKLRTFSELDRRVSARPVAESLKRRGWPDVCLGDLPRAWRYGLQFYAARPLPDCTENSGGIRVEAGENSSIRIE